MTSRDSRRPGVRTALIAAAAAGALVIGGVAVAAVAHTAGTADASAQPGPATPAPTQSANGFAAGGLQDPALREDAVDLGVPTRVQIPRIDVDSTLEDLALGDGGELEAPVDYDLAGWYSDGVVPGSIGPAIIAGHVDSPTAPAVFARIAELQVGDEVIVTMSSGETLTFEITDARQSAKASFPTDAVYSNVPRPELRLITCAGAFDTSIGHYTDNLILFASIQT